MLQSSLLSVSLVLMASAVAPADSQPTPQKIPRQLLEKRLEAARKVFEQNLVRLKGAEGLPSDVFGWSEKVLEAELALAEQQSERVKPLRDHLDRTREIERLVTGFAERGQGRQTDADAATYYRLEAEIRLLKEGFEPHPVKGTKGTDGKK